VRFNLFFTLAFFPFRHSEVHSLRPFSRVMHHGHKMMQNMRHACVRPSSFHLFLWKQQAACTSSVSRFVLLHGLQWSKIPLLHLHRIRLVDIISSTSYKANQKSNAHLPTYLHLILRTPMIFPDCQSKSPPLHPCSIPGSM